LISFPFEPLREAFARDYSTQDLRSARPYGECDGIRCTCDEVEQTPTSHLGSKAKGEEGGKKEGEKRKGKKKRLYTRLVM
jgi:hypothetical protein